MPARVRVLAPVFAVAAALLLAACSGSATTPSAEGTQPAGAASSASAASASATPSTASPSPSPAATPMDTLVILWYGNGGADKLDDLISSVARVEAQHAEGRAVIELNKAFAAVRAARSYTPIPDPETQAAWAAAIEHLGSGMKTVLSTSALDPGPSMAPEQAKETEAKGWEEFATGMAGLRDVDKRLQAFGCLPHGDPWKA
ncbi:hypothetical protein ACGFX4_31580 [Kitasatospora sp. NPDC048365]|uniref:hypothetical protein n=1 Tax=Kitasatospora sp. NPDC048365 TaxID=3364050 RepID=UPI0037180573